MLVPAGGGERKFVSGTEGGESKNEIGTLNGIA